MNRFFTEISYILIAKTEIHSILSRYFTLTHEEKDQNSARRNALDDPKSIRQETSW